MADLTIVERVQAGAAWLDEHKPGWWHLIDLNRLDIGSCQRCVLGQLYGEYCDSPFDARWAGGLETFVGDMRGFHSLAQLSRRAEAEDDAALTEAWRTLIEERRSGVPA